MLVLRFVANERHQQIVINSMTARDGGNTDIALRKTLPIQGVTHQVNDIENALIFTLKCPNKINTPPYFAGGKTELMNSMLLALQSTAIRKATQIYY
jgi:hypothetical protein